MVIFHTHTSQFVCTHCGCTYDPKFPQPIGALTALSTWFKKAHKKCVSQKPFCIVCLTFGHVGITCPCLQLDMPLDWLNGPDTGISSKVICAISTGDQPVPDPPNPPQDPDDFGRCYRLLKLFPWMRVKLDDVAERFPEWRGLVDHWDELTVLYEEELPTGRAPKLFARMRELLEVKP